MAGRHGGTKIDRIAAAFYKEVNRQMEQDIPIWNKKVYRPRPALTAGDGPIRWVATCALVNRPRLHNHPVMADCTHLDRFAAVTPGTDGCAECLATGGHWVHLRICRVCGHVGCCDQSPGKHATAHFHETGHPVMESYDPPDGWGWCYVDEVMIGLGDFVTPHPPGWRW